ncbi:unnamed protein product [Rotaria socialis]|uniref:Uncharacterized protein n=1 Tax=Rotaria socialis TaxID=392032 RepID=A0A821G1T0_9BILA|nr:unnamed protein product [Rotaria socialis]
MIDTLSVKQIAALSEVVFGIASEAKFDIYDDKNVQILHALETSTFGNVFVVHLDGVSHYVLLIPEMDGAAKKSPRHRTATIYFLILIPPPPRL